MEAQVLICQSQELLLAKSPSSPPPVTCIHVVEGRAEMPHCVCGGQLGESLRSDTVGQVWQQARLPTEPSCQPPAMLPKICCHSRCWFSACQGLQPPEGRAPLPPHTTIASHLSTLPHNHTGNKWQSWNSMPGSQIHLPPNPCSNPSPTVSSSEPLPALLRSKQH